LRGQPFGKKRLCAFIVGGQSGAHCSAGVNRKPVGCTIERSRRIVSGSVVARSIDESLRPAHEQRFSLHLVLDIPVLGYTLLLSIGTAVVFGLIPALRASKTNLSSATKGEITAFGRESSPITDASSIGRDRDLSLSGLAARRGLADAALGRAETLDPGFDMKHVLAVSMDLNLHGTTIRELPRFTSVSSNNYKPFLA